MLIIPDLAAASCRIMAACGFIQNGDSAVVGWLAAHRQWTDYLLQVPSGPMFARVGMGGNPPRCTTHCHIDLATPEQFDTPSPAKLGEKEFQDAFSPLMGQKVKITLRARFVLGFDVHPSIIRSLSKWHSLDDDVAVRLTSGTFSIRGSVPIVEMKWKLIEGKDRLVDFEFAARHTTTITEAYLVESLEMMKIASTALTKGGIQHATH